MWLTCARTVENEDVNGVFNLCKLICKFGYIDILELIFSIFRFSNSDKVCIILIVGWAMPMKGDQVNHKDLTFYKLWLDLQILELIQNLLTQAFEFQLNIFNHYALWPVHLFSKQLVQPLSIWVATG